MEARLMSRKSLEIVDYLLQEARTAEADGCPDEAATLRGVVDWIMDADQGLKVAARWLSEHGRCLETCASITRPGGDVCDCGLRYIEDTVAEARK